MVRSSGRSVGGMSLGEGAGREFAEVPLCLCEELAVGDAGLGAEGGETPRMAASAVPGATTSERGLEDVAQERLLSAAGSCAFSGGYGRGSEGQPARLAGESWPFPTARANQGRVARVAEAGDLEELGRSNARVAARSGCRSG